VARVGEFGTGSGVWCGARIGKLTRLNPASGRKRSSRLRWPRPEAAGMKEKGCKRVGNGLRWVGVVSTALSHVMRDHFDGVGRESRMADVWNKQMKRTC
jgi:hypothetical protein